MTTATSQLDLLLYDDLYRMYSPRLEERLEWRLLPTFVPNKDLPIHNWFYCPQAFSHQLVEELLALLSTSTASKVLDPFCGIGTTLHTCSEKGIRSVGCDIFPLFCFVTKVKCEKNYSLPDLERGIEYVVEHGAKSVPTETPKHPLFEKAFSPGALKQLLSYKNTILSAEDERVRDFLLLGLLSIVNEVSYIRKAGAHYRFINVDRAGVKHQYKRLEVREPNVKEVFKQKLYRMLGDVSFRRENLRKYVWQDRDDLVPDVRIADARDLSFLEAGTVDAVITSPPYLNRDSYVAQYKLELFLAEPPYGVREFKDYRDITFRTLRSHVEAKQQEKYKATLRIREIELLVDELRKRDLSYKSIPDMVRGYFEDMSVVLRELNRVLKGGSRSAIVVGNVRFGGVPIPVDLLLSRTAEEIGFHVEKIVVARYKMNSPQQMKRYGKVPVRESIVIVQK